jgi:hypothetical protein
MAGDASKPVEELRTVQMLDFSTAGIQEAIEWATGILGGARLNQA